MELIDRISGRDGLPEIMTKLTEGNPGALSVCMQIAAQAAAIDPDSALGGLGGLLALDTERIYGSRIWMLYKDVCGEDLTLTLGLLRACQLGMLARTDLNAAIDNYGQGVDPAEILLKVQKRSPAFGAIEQPASSE